MGGARAASSLPHLGLQSYGDTDDGSSSSGELRHSASAGARRRRSYGDVLPLGAADGGVAVPSGKPRRHASGVVVGGDDEHQADTCLRRYETAPGYVSFEDVIGTAAFRDSSGRPPEAAISDPLVRTASRLYAREAFVLGRPPQHWRRQRSPGPLGTRRGSAMHGLVKKYVHPFFGLIAGIFCCAIPS